MKQGRVRTESMVQRFAKTVIGEGYDLWDRDYLLGAMRLFIFKSETAPPFQVGPCLDATGEILMQIDEYEDAAEQFAMAAEKYQLIQQPLLAELMRIKSDECLRGAPAALERVESFLAAPPPPDAAGRSNAAVAARARAHAYHAELLLRAAADLPGGAGGAGGAGAEGPGGDLAGGPGGPGAGAGDLVARAVAAARLSCRPEWDRAHAGHLALGDALQAAGELEAAREAFAAAAAANGKCLAAREREIEIVKHFIAQAGEEDAERVAQLRAELLVLLDAAIALHPHSALLREKAFLISDTDGDAEALAFLDPLIQNPPPEEADALRGVAGKTVATLLKAKAAILADGGNITGALNAAQAALRETPRDEEAAAIVTEIQQIASGEGG